MFVIGGPVAKLVEYSKRYDIAWIQKKSSQGGQTAADEHLLNASPLTKIGDHGRIYESNPNLCIVFNKNRPSSRHYYPPG